MNKCSKNDILNLTLDHEVLDDPMEVGTLVTVAEGAPGQSREVIDSSRSGVTKESVYDAAGILTVYRDVHIHLLGHRSVSSLKNSRV